MNIVAAPGGGFVVAWQRRGAVDWATLELRGLAATKPEFLTALGRIFAEEVARATKRLAGVAVAGSWIDAPGCALAG